MLLEGLNAIDWSKVEHAYGPATDVPFMIRALASDDAEDGRAARAARFAAWSSAPMPARREMESLSAWPCNACLDGRCFRTRRAALLGACVAGYLSPIGGPSTKPMADYGETTELLDACVLAGEPAVPLCARLISDDDPRLRARAAWLCVHLSHEPQAIQLLDMALKKNETTHAMWGEAVFALGGAHAGEGRWEEALALYVKADPFLDEDGKELVRQNRIAVLQRLGRQEEALAIQMDRTPDDDDAMGFYHLGLAQVKAGKWRACIASIEKSLALDPNHANSHYTIACAHALLGEADAAVAAIECALAIEPDLAPDIAEDSDFASLQDDPRFQKLVAESSATALARAEVDQ